MIFLFILYILYLVVVALLREIIIMSSCEFLSPTSLSSFGCASTVAVSPTLLCSRIIRYFFKLSPPRWLGEMSQAARLTGSLTQIWRDHFSSASAPTKSMSYKPNHWQVQPGAKLGRMAVPIQFRPLSPAKKAIVRDAP